MGRSFHYGTDAVLRNGSAAFAKAIVQDAGAYGLTQAQADAYASLAQAFDVAYTAAIDPAMRTHGRILTKNERRLELRQATSALARIIDGAPGVSDPMKVGLGLSLQRDTTRPSQPPGTPWGFRVALSAVGGLTLSWSCTHPTRGSGTVYQIWRGVDEAAGPLTFIGHTGVKRYVDATIPRGASHLTYEVQAVRSTGSGAVARHEVFFGGRTLPSAVRIAA